MDKPTFDENGYPSEETLDTVRLWDYKNHGLSELMEFIGKAWNCKFGSWRKHEHVIIASTGGWSGNEDLIDALHDTVYGKVAWSWMQEEKGGHFTFEPRLATACQWADPKYYNSHKDPDGAIGPAGDRS